MYKPYRVEIHTFSTHTYEVDARTPEEAEEIAETYFKDGEAGMLHTEDIDSTETTPLDEEEAVQE